MGLPPPLSQALPCGPHLRQPLHLRALYPTPRENQVNFFFSLLFYMARARTFSFFLHTPVHPFFTRPGHPLFFIYIFADLFTPHPFYTPLVILFYCLHLIIDILTLLHICCGREYHSSKLDFTLLDFCLSSQWMRTHPYI